MQRQRTNRTKNLHRLEARYTQATVAGGPPRRALGDPVARDWRVGRMAYPVVGGVANAFARRV